MKRRSFLKCAMILTAGAWSVRAATLGRPPGPDKGKPTIKLTPQIEAFIRAKEQQARADTQAAGEKVSPEVWAYFTAATQGNWAEVSRLWEILADRSGQYEKPRDSKADPTVRTAAWQPVLEVDLGLRVYAYDAPEFAEAFGYGIINSIPNGAIYFGGTDPGRGTVTALCKSQINADPFFTLTQNALADSSYLAYLRRMYGTKIQIPTEDDSKNTFAEYVNDAKHRLEHDRQFPTDPRQIKPGEDVHMENDQVQVSGQVAVMSINALLARLIFDKNPDREFYIEESFPLDWMYPYLSPHGLIMKVNRQALDTLPETAASEDRKFWTRQAQQFLGDWLTFDTSLKQVCTFARQVFVNKQYSEFKPDPKFVKDDDACKEFSKLRSSIGGVYAWRATKAKSQAERKRMADEADFAFRQAFALCPSSPEAVFRYINLLLTLDRIPDAVMVAETAHKVDPDNSAIDSLVKQLQTMGKK